MPKRFNIKSLLSLSQPPAQNKPTWFSNAEESVAFLTEDAASDEIVIYASLPHVLIHRILAPIENLNPADLDDLRKAHIFADSSWAITHSWGGGEGHRVYLSSPMDEAGSKSLAGGEKLIFHRIFHGVGSKHTPIELSQKLVHSLQIYFVEERNAFCRLDQRGDIEDVIRIIEVPESGQFRGGIVVTILVKELSEYMVLSGTGLVTIFDFTRYPPDSFSGWSNQDVRTHNAPDLFYNVGVMSGHASYVSGRMVARPTLTLEEIIDERVRAQNPTAQKYAIFKIQDFKNNKLVECSCSPDSRANYFQKDSLLPFDTSPAFFRAEVLHRFKADLEKYSLDDRTISCRNAWDLKTYDINEAGQVHTYLVYLADLPYEEQLYWQSFNEWPNAPISKRAIENDFKGTWSSEYDPLATIKYNIEKIDRERPDWWNPRAEELHTAARNPATNSSAEWANEILALDQLIIEGFVPKALREKAIDLGRKVEKGWGSLKLIEECLVGLGRSEEQAKEVMTALRKLHELRNQLKGHAAVVERKRLEREAITDHGNYRAHFMDLAAKCDLALGKIFISFGLSIDQE